MNSAIRAAIRDDVKAIVNLHLTAFPDFFLSELGARFLARLYRAYVDDPECICFIAGDEDSLFGFVIGTTKPKRFYRRLLWSRGAAFFWDALPTLLRNPSRVAARLLRGLRYRGEVPVRYPHALLISSVAVSPDHMGTGIAIQLLESFCLEAKARGATHVYLTTDRDDNPIANRFYVRNGFELDAVLSRYDGRAMNRYVRSLV
ncbi:MAG: GNAT family N-acetyltransferase [Gammaproteobacteria bacterium]|nr:GNAT family N-acetyltransferase [Gammaproteobacteria bacterium]